MSNYVALILSLATPRRPSMAQLAGKKRFLQCPSEVPWPRSSFRCLGTRAKRAIEACGSPGSSDGNRKEIEIGRFKRFRFDGAAARCCSVDYRFLRERCKSLTSGVISLLLYIPLPPPPARVSSHQLMVHPRAATHATTTLRGRSLTHVGQVSSAS